jgi:hypothetical protein
MPFLNLDFCDLLWKLRSHVFFKDRDIYLQPDRRLFLGDTTEVASTCLVPVGIIAMWAGLEEDVPAGWSLCNGENGTPDLRNRFIVGSGDAYDTGDVGGQDSVDLQHDHGGATGAGTAHTHASGTYATDNEASHTHTSGGYYAANDTHSHGPGTLRTGGADTSGEAQTGTGVNVTHVAHSHQASWSGLTADDTHSHDVAGSSGSAGAHSHDVTGSSGSESAHTHPIDNALSATQSVLNPYYALAYIMRTA